MSPDALWDTHQVAEFLNISTITVERWRRDNGLPFFRIGRTIRFVPTDVRQWVEDRRVVNDAGPVTRAAPRRSGRSSEFNLDGVPEHPRTRAEA